MWMFVVIVALLDQNQAAPSTGERGGSLQLQQLDLTTPSTVTYLAEQRTSSSSSSSSESSQSSEEPQQMRERQNLENTAVEEADSSQESSELLKSPSNSSTSLWLSELVSLGERVGVRDRKRDTGDESVERESKHRALLLTFHPLLSRTQTTEPGLTTEEGGAVPTVGGASKVEGVARGAEVDAEFPQLSEESKEQEEGLMYNLPDHAHNHGDEAELELGL
ncbi:uncharacterized protein LOC130164352 [Seriola aureovittata]|uniref:uncharacterized protein LOC130164352 n=1 Tax=Seriola aureovittata TaxID=2871759 RepID=UPI0024BD7348|nr:uncharacterized protein LOC130164352 [Seriola aureovittata]